MLLAAATAYAVLLAVLVLGPWGWGLNRATVRLYVLFRYDWPVAPDRALPEHYGVLLNVLLFVPVGAFVVLMTGRLWRAALASALLSVAVEGAQWAWLQRQAQLSDVVANTLGGVLGALGVVVVLVVSRLARARSRRATPRESGRPR